MSAFFLWLAFRGQNLSATWAALRSAEYIYVLPAVALYFAGVWARALRWQALLSPIGRYRVGSLFPVVVIGFTANNLLPARMGEVVRVFVLSQREGVPKSSALATVVVERLMDAVTMLGLLAFAALLVPLTGPIERVATVAGLVLLVALAPLVGLALAPAACTALFARLGRLLPARLAERLAGVGGSFVSGLAVVRSGRALLASFGLSVAAWLLESGMYWTLAQGFDLRVGPAVILLTLAVANLATLVPAAPGYVGSFEVGALLVLSGLAGIAREPATGYVLALHAALVIPVTLLGLYYWASHHLSLGRIRQAEQSFRVNAFE